MLVGRTMIHSHRLRWIDWGVVRMPRRFVFDVTLDVVEKDEESVPVLDKEREQVPFKKREFKVPDFEKSEDSFGDLGG